MAKKHDEEHAIERPDADAASSAAAAETALGTFAEDLGRLLGTAQAKAATWLEQRKTIADELTKIRDAANHYLQQLSDAGAAAMRAAQARQPGRPAGRAKAKRRPPAPAARKSRGGRKRTLSEETKARMRASQQARWARKRAAADGGS